MRKKLFDVQIAVEIETLPGGSMKIIAEVPPDAPTVGQLVGLPIGVMGEAMALVERQMAAMYQTAQMQAFEASLGGGQAADISGLGGRRRPSTA